tara:strand:+ start:21 stop:131 length:111 start_codon:yes stop_codon:yes gene_type:complete
VLKQENKDFHKDLGKKRKKVKKQQKEKKEKKEKFRI